MRSPAVYDHLSPTDADCPDGVYRVVGSSDGTVTLLRITDADGRRAHTGEVATVDADALDGFEPVARLRRYPITASLDTNRRHIR